MGLISFTIDREFLQEEENPLFIFPRSEKTVVYLLDTNKFSFRIENENLIISNRNNDSVTIESYLQKIDEDVWFFTEQGGLLSPMANCDFVEIAFDMSTPDSIFSDQINRLSCIQEKFDIIEEINILNETE